MRIGEAAFDSRRLAELVPLGEAAFRERRGRSAGPRTEVAAAFVAYLRRLGAPEAALKAARRLARPGVPVVATGQQAGLLGGPALTFYKAHSALGRAGREGVAVFWVASQDHDTEEVAGLCLLDRSERLLAERLPLPVGPPVGRIPFAPYRERLKAWLADFDGDPEAKAAVLAALAPAAGYAEAFARLLVFAFGERGLLPLDPMAPEFAPLFVPLLARELDDPLGSVAALAEGAVALKARGFRPTLGRPPGATNLFLEDEEGTRRLLFYRRGRFWDGRRSYTRADLRAVLEADPARLTPAAALRPVFQDALLASAGFVVGPGELAYVAELAPVYRHHGVPMPAVLPRLRAVVVEPPVARILARYRLDAWRAAEDPEAALDARLAGLLAEASGAEAALERARAAVGEAEARLAAFEPTLVPAAGRVRRRLDAEFERLFKKLARARRNRQSVLAAQAERLQKHLRPCGKPQEAALPYLNFYLKHGERALFALAEAPLSGRAVIAL